MIFFYIISIISIFILIEYRKMAAPRINILSNILMGLLILPLVTLCWASKFIFTKADSCMLRLLYNNQFKREHCLRTNAIRRNAINVLNYDSANLRINIVQSRLK